MRYPTLDLASIWENYPDIFDQFVYPKVYEPTVNGEVVERQMTDAEKEELIDNILFRTEGLESLYTDPVILKNRIRMFTRTESRIWNDYSRGLGYRWTYNPTENVFEKSSVVRAIAVEGADGNTETRNLDTTNREDRNLVNSNRESRDLITEDSESRDLVNASSDNKNFNNVSVDELNLKDSSAKVTDLTDTNNETRNGSKTYGENKQGTNADTETRDLKSASVNTKNLRDVVNETNQNSETESRADSFEDDNTERRQTVNGETTVKNLNDSEHSQKNAGSSSVGSETGHSRRDPSNLEEDSYNTGATIDMVDGYAGSGSGSSGSISEGADGGSGSFTGSLPIDKARTEGAKAHKDYTGYEDNDSTNTKNEASSTAETGDTTQQHTGAESKSGSVSDELRKQDSHAEHHAGVKASNGSVANDAVHTGTDSTSSVDAGDIRREGVAGEIKSGVETEGGQTESSAAHRGTEITTDAHGGTKSNNANGFETNAHTGSETGNISRRGAETGGVVNSGMEGGYLANTGHEGGSITNNGNHRETTSDSTATDRHGNIGVTKSSELIMDQLELIKNELFTFVTNDFKKNMTLQIY